MLASFGLKRDVHTATLKIKVLIRVPTRTGKPGKMGRHFPVRKKVRKFGIDWKSQGK